METNQQMIDPLLKVENLCKSFGSVQANMDITFDIVKGEVHCLLGENGAGKSTLSECLYGFYKPDTGRIYFKGEHLNLNSPRDAINAGIGMVHQHFILASPMTVIENIIVGIDHKGPGLNLKQASRKISELCQTYGIDLDPNAVVANLSVGQQQWVEILKALYVGVDLLILDEPTAVLTPQEAAKLFTILRKMTGQGLSILLITHKLYEVLSISDRVTVLRKGHLVDTVNTKDTNRDDLARMMVGRDVNFKVAREALKPGEPILDLVDIHVHKDNGLPALNGISLRIHKHEIVCLAGVAGNGQKELFDLIVGVRKAFQGKMFLDGEEITNLSPLKIHSKGIAGIPPDRLREGLLMNFTVEENLILGLHHKKDFKKYGMFDQRSINDYAVRSIAEYDIACPSGGSQARTLSGGNLQKVILARELSENPKFVIASSPTRGLDVGAMEYVHKKLVQLRSEGAGILLISEDLDEVFNLADILAVIYKGRIVGICRAENTTREQVGLLMAGIVEGAA